MFNALGRHLLHRLKYAEDNPTDQNIRMFEKFAHADDDLTIDNTGMMNMFKQAENDWEEAIRQNASQERLTDIRRQARAGLHREVWLMDRDMNSPVFGDGGDWSVSVFQYDFQNNFDRFNPRRWKMRHGDFRARPEAPWYRMHARETLSRLFAHGYNPLPLRLRASPDLGHGPLPDHHYEVVDHDYDILRMHVTGRKSYLMTPEDLRTQEVLNQIHGATRLENDMVGLSSHKRCR